MNPKTGYENLTKVLKSHLTHCKVHEFSLQANRHCTCGVEKAREELDKLVTARMEAFDEAMGVVEAGDDWNVILRKIFRLANPDLSTGESK